MESLTSKELDVSDKLRAIAKGVYITNAMRAGQIEEVADDIDQFMEWVEPQITHYAEQRIEIERLQRELAHWKECHGVTADALAAARAGHEPCARSGVGDYCTVGPASEQAQKFLLMFEDRDRGVCIYPDEHQARTAFAEAESRGWNCHLFGLLRRAAQPPPVSQVCSTCAGTGEVDETLGGEHFSNPHAPCPDCDGAAEEPEARHLLSCDMVTHPNCTRCSCGSSIAYNESRSGGNPGEKSASRPADHRGIVAARSSEGGIVGQNPGETIQSCEPVGSDTASGSAGEPGALDTRKVLTPHGPLSASALPPEATPDIELIRDQCEQGLIAEHDCPAVYALACILAEITPEPPALGSTKGEGQ